MVRFIKDKQMLIKKIFMVILDILSIIFSSIFALMLRFELSYSSIDAPFKDALWSYLPINIAVTLVLFYMFRLYSSLWTFASVTELENVVSACACSAVAHFIGILISPWNLPRSFYFIYLFVLTACTCMTRFAYRALRLQRKRFRMRGTGTNVMIIGAGDAANMIIREINSSEHLNQTIKCVIDDDKTKTGSYIQGVRVVGTRDDIAKNVAAYKIDEIIIAIPSASRTLIKEITNSCKDTNCSLKILPGIDDLVGGRASLSQLRNVEVEDLLGREPVKVDLDQIVGYTDGKVVLVTGGGGSIGSELCRQLASHRVRQLIILDIYENNAYDIQQELIRKYPDLDLVVLIASVRNTKRINMIFDKYRPDIVFHAAAHKHVPLMENSPNEALKNNVFGTYKTVKAADRVGVEKFILISTDKAVNPTNIMGASKRICEMIIQSYNKRSKTEFVAVRFGNVLGSNGSVIPLFKKQIAKGGPVTVTHPDIIRYFMTIPEAVSLVLQAGAYAKGGEIFVLDMGEPVKILDLAVNLIRLSGFVPDKDIKIEFTGLRPGEKLYEELLMDEEGLKDTANKMIHIGKPIEMDDEAFLKRLDDLYYTIIDEPDSGEVKKIVKELVPTYKERKE